MHHKSEQYQLIEIASPRDTRKTVKIMKTSRINFGILVNLGNNNAHYRQDFDRLNHLKKIDANNYVKTFEREGYTNNEDMIEDGMKMFEDDAIWVKNLDEFGMASSFYLVCYFIDNDGNPSGVERIKELLY